MAKFSNARADYDRDSDWKPCDLSYYELLRESERLAREVSRRFERLFIMESYCDDLPRVYRELENAICHLEELRKVTEYLLREFDPCCFYCSEVAYGGILRTHNTSRYMIELAKYLLDLDICTNNQELRFFIESLRKLTDEAQINRTNLQLALDDYREECK